MVILIRSRTRTGLWAQHLGQDNPRATEGAEASSPRGAKAHMMDPADTGNWSPVHRLYSEHELVPARSPTLILSAFISDDGGFPGGSDGKDSACSAGDLGLIPGLGRSPGEGNGNLLQDSCLENSIDRGIWWATVHGLQRVRHNWATNTHTHYKWGWSS